VVGRELYPDPPLASAVDDAVPTVVLEDAPAKDSSPERALRVQVRCVEDDDVAHHSHDRITDFPKDRRAASRGPGFGRSVREYPRATLKSLITRVARLADMSQSARRHPRPVN
jgi:hypothetical protein